MSMNKLNPHAAHQLSATDWVDFLYATEESIFEPFFEASRVLSAKKMLIASLTLSEQCVLNCSFCHFRRDLSMPSINESSCVLFSDDMLVSVMSGIHQLGVSHVLIESGVFAKSQQHQLHRQLRLLREGLSAASLYLDIGSQSFLDDVSLIESGESLFLDYVPARKAQVEWLQVFDKQADLIEQIRLSKQSNSKIDFYANFIVDLPGLSFEEVVEDLFFLLSMPIDGVKISPFLARRDTVFEIFEKACLLTTLKIICIIRLLKPDWNIFVEPNIETLGFPDAMKRAMKVGANYAVLDFNDLLKRFPMPVQSALVEHVQQFCRDNHIQ